MIRCATKKDIIPLLQLEHETFSFKERCKRETLEKRISLFPDQFLVYEKEGKVISYLSYMISDSIDIPTLSLSPKRNDKKGKYILLLSLCCFPKEQGKGIGTKLMNTLLENTDKDIYLLCQENRLSFYERFDFYTQERISLDNRTWLMMKRCCKINAGGTTK